MNGPSSMYTLRPVVNLSEDIEFPKCMYSMKNIQTNVYKDKVTGPAPVAHSGVLNTQHAEKNRLNILEQVNILLKKPLPGMKDLEIRQEAVLTQLAQLKQQVALLKASLKQSTANPSAVQQGNKPINAGQNKSFSKSVLFQHDIVINASPKCLPYFLLALSNMWKDSLRMKISWHTHSNIVKATAATENFMSADWKTNSDETLPLLKIFVVWKDVGNDTELLVSPMSRIAIRGDVNILRYLCRLGPSHFNYDDVNKLALTTEIDSVLDACHSLSWSRTVKAKQTVFRSLNAKLGKSTYFAGDNVTIADVATWSVLKQLSDLTDLTVNMTKWLKRCSETFNVKEA